MEKTTRIDWLKSIARWTIGKTLYLSVPFTWMLPQAVALAREYDGPVIAGGPAVQLRPDVLKGLVKAVNQPCPVEPLLFHNPLATWTSKGCVNSCGFCAVPRLEGDFVQLPEWRLAPILCDNNLLASTRSHFNRVIDRLKLLPKETLRIQSVDFNQGLEARRLKPHHVRRLAELKAVKVRFAFDHVNHESAVAEAVKLCRSQGLKDFGIYVLIGFNDTPEDALYRLEKVRSWGIHPNPMRYQPLDTLAKNAYVSPAWDEEMLKAVVRYYSRLVWLGHISFEEYCAAKSISLNGSNISTPKEVATHAHH